MKRASTRLGQQTLTLSLLSSLVLLAACGGGGKDEPAAAAPAAVPSGPVETPQVPDPTLADVTAADEPYLVAVSSVEYKQDVEAKAPTFQLNILDGKTQTVLHKIAFGKPLTQQWLTVNKIERAFKELADPDNVAANLPGKFVVETDKGPAHLYFIQEGVVRHIDLSRRAEAKPVITSTQVSNIADACTLVESDSYPLKLDGSSTALVVTTAGTDKDCAKTEDNVRVLITSDDASDTLPRTLAAPSAKMVKRIYSEGTLSAVLVQEAIPKDDPKATITYSKLSLLSPTQETVLKSPVALPTTDPKNPITNFRDKNALGTEQGAEWLADMPNQDGGSGYLRLQTLSSSVIYKLIWDAGAKAAEFSLAQTLSGTQTSVKSANDGLYTYFAFNNIAYRGPVAGANPFEIISNLGILELESKVSGLTPQYQTKTHVIYTQNDPATSGWAVPKSKANGAAYKLFQSEPQRGAPIQVVGQRGNTLVVLGKDGFDNAGMGVATLDIQRAAKDGNITFAQVHNIALTTPIWTATRINGQAGIDTLIVRAQGGGVFNTVDLANMKLGIGLGEVDSAFADAPATVTPGKNNLATLNNRFDVTMSLYGYVTSRDPWLYNVGVKNSLLKIDTFAEDAAK